MIIIWGTKSRQEGLGVAADWCETCSKVQPFSVTQYFRVSHIYYISLNSGTLVATVRECWQCGSKFHCDPGKYNEFLREDEVPQLPRGEVLRRTNDRLKRYLDSKRQNPTTSDQQSSRPKEILEILDVLPAEEDDTEE
jgi:hypothetical protein